MVSQCVYDEPDDEYIKDFIFDRIDNIVQRNFSVEQHSFEIFSKIIPIVLSRCYILYVLSYILNKKANRNRLAFLALMEAASFFEVRKKDTADSRIGFK